MSWLLYALLACVSLCAAIETTRRARLDGFDVLLYRALLAGFMLLPFSMYMIWPGTIWFYVMVAGFSGLSAYTAVVMSNLALKRNGRVAMMLHPLAIIFTLIFWGALNPLDLAALFQKPMTAGLTGTALLALILALQIMRRNDYAWVGLRAILPVALGQAVLYVALKHFLSQGAVLAPGLILTLLMLGNFGMVLALPVLARFRIPGDELNISRRAKFPLLPLAAIAVLHTLSWAALMAGITLAPNPAYPVAMMALAPLVFHLYYWVRGWPDRASPWAGLAMAGAACALGFLHP